MTLEIRPLIGHWRMSLEKEFQLMWKEHEKRIQYYCGDRVVFASVMTVTRENLPVPQELSQIMLTKIKSESYDEIVDLQEKDSIWSVGKIVQRKRSWKFVGLLPKYDFGGYDLFGTKFYASEVLTVVLSYMKPSHKLWAIEAFQSINIET